MNKLDRYILKGFIATLSFSVLALCVIFLVVDFMEALEKFLDHKAGIKDIASYYLYYLPQIIKLIFPIAMLLASLFSIGRLSGANEITAMKSAGQSLFRLMLPIVCVSAALSAAQLYFNGWVVPRAQTKMLALDRRFLGRSSGPVETQFFNLYFRDTPFRNVIMSSYDEVSKSGSNISIEDYRGTSTPRITHRFDAQQFHWDDARSTWVMNDGFERRISDTTGTVSTRAFRTDTLNLHMTHDNIVELQRTTDEMNLDELHEYINMLERGGKDVRMKRIDFFGQYAFPFANLIVVLFGVPFASVRKKGGIAVEIATAMIVTFSYLVFTKISQSMGFELNLSPVVVGWSANAIFLLLAVINLRFTRS